MKSHRNFMFILLVATLAIMASFALSACDKENNYTYTYSNEASYTVAGEGTAQSAVIRNLDIEWYNGSVDVKKGEATGEIAFEEVTEGGSLSFDTTMHYYVDGTTLRIRYSKSGKVTVGGLKKHLYVTVPSDMILREVDVEGISANVTVEGITADEVSVNTASGAVRVECNATEIDVETTSGDAYLKCISSTSLDVETVSGDLLLVCSFLPSSLEIETRTGDIELRLAEYKGFSIDFETNSGLFVNALTNIEIQKRNGRYTFVYGDGAYPSGQYAYEIETLSGNLKIEALSGNPLS